MKKSILIVIFCSLLVINVVFYYEKQLNINNLTNISDVYKDFMQGNRKVFFNEETYYLSELADMENGYYVFCDVDNDMAEELNIKSNGNYYVIKWLSPSLKVLYWGHTYEFPVHDGTLSGIVYYRLGGAPLNEVYKFSEIDSVGEIRTVIEFEWCDMNENDGMDDGDYYDINGSETNMENWLNSTEQYRNLCIKKTVWKRISDFFYEEYISMFD